MAVLARSVLTHSPQRPADDAAVPDGPLTLAELDGLMARGPGSRKVRIALLDGPVATGHLDLADTVIRPVAGYSGVACTRSASGACAHGTFVAGILAARRGSGAPALCPGCTLLVRPIFAEAAGGRISPSTPDEVAAAIVESVATGARIVNLSAATGQPSIGTERRLRQALDHASRHGVLVVAAAGNQATLGSTTITRHPGVIPVTALDRSGRPLASSNLAATIGRRGLAAPGESIVSLAARGGLTGGAGTSVAAAFVTGTIALLASLYPGAGPTELRAAVAGGGRRRAVTPPALSGERALSAMQATNRRRVT